MTTTSKVLAFSPPRSGVLRKIGLALLTGGVVYLITNLTNLGQIWALTITAFLGSVVLVVQFLVEFEDRLMGVEGQQTQRLEEMERKQVAHADEMRELVRQSFAKVNEATALFGRVEESGLRAEPVIELVQHSARLNPVAPALIRRLAEHEVQRTAEFLKELSGGAVSYEGEDRDWLLTLAAHAQRSIDATSLNTVDTRGKGPDSSFWQSDLGQRYLKVQRARAKAGVKIRRIFIVDKPSVVTSVDFLSACRKQAAMNIDVRILDYSDNEDLFDMVLFDDMIMYETTPATSVDGASPPGILHTQLVLRPDVVHKRVEQYHDLWESARPLLLD
jgi:hypothetical protein